MAEICLVSKLSVFIWDPHIRRVEFSLKGSSSTEALEDKDDLNATAYSMIYVNRKSFPHI